MERAVALKKLGNILGKKLGYRVDPRAPTQEEREAASAELSAAMAERKALDEKMITRSQAILEADSEYQTLRAAYRQAKERASRLGSLARHYKITVGTSEGMFFMVRAEGDSWEDVIAKLQTKRAA